MQTWLTGCANLVGKNVVFKGKVNCVYGLDLPSLDQTRENDGYGDGPVPD